MSRAILVMLLFADVLVFGQAWVELDYEPEAVTPNSSSLLELNHSIAALYVCDTITVQVFMNGALRAAKNPADLLAARETKLRQLFSEEQIRPEVFRFETIDVPDNKRSCAAVIIGTHPFQISQERVFEADTTIVNEAGWRVMCKVSKAQYAKDVVVEERKVYDYLVENATHAVLTTGEQLGISAVYAITVPDSLAHFHDVQVLIPINEKLSGSTILCVPFQGRFRPYSSKRSKAKCKTRDKQVFLTLPVKASCEVAVAEVVRAKAPVAFAAPSGFVFIKAEYRANQPANNTCGYIEQGEAVTSFDVVADAADACYRFEVEDLDGQRFTSDWLTPEELRKDYKCKRVTSKNGAEALLLSNLLFVEPAKLAHHE